MLQKSLEILFKSRDVSLVKIYIQRQFRKLLEGNVNIQDFIIAKEYRGRDYYSAGASVPALHLARLVTDRCYFFCCLFVCYFSVTTVLQMLIRLTSFSVDTFSTYSRFKGFLPLGPSLVNSCNGLTMCK